MTRGIPIFNPQKTLTPFVASPGIVMKADELETEGEVRVIRRIGLTVITILSTVVQ